MAIEFFGAVDRQGGQEKGRICSEYPAWYFDVKVEDMEREVAEQDSRIERGFYPPDRVGNVRAENERKKLKLANIVSSKPVLDGKDKDFVHKVYKELGAGIRDNMFTHSEMMKGLASAHEEANLMTKGCVAVTKDVARMAKKCGIKLEKGQKLISRNQASRMFKICGKALGEPTNTERLRRDRNTGTFQMDRKLEDMER